MNGKKPAKLMGLVMEFFRLVTEVLAILLIGTVMSVAARGGRRVAHHVYMI